MVSELIGSGAEGYVERTDEGVRKVRPQKRYRHPLLDKKLRQFRTRREAKILKRFNSPKLLSVDDKEMTLVMEYVDGPQLRDVLDDKNADIYAKKIGSLIRRLHDSGIIHGDLTTSNMLVKQNELFLIDYGLSFFSETIEDRAVDLHLLMHCLHAKHPSLDLWPKVLESYYPSKELMARFEEVELRGRYKQKGS